jgi:spermidine synthase
MAVKQSFRTFLTKRGARLIQHGTVLSEALSEPGPTHSVADVLAAIIHLHSPGPRVAVLGFAAGGLIAPLRKLGCRHEIDAVDLDERGYRIFQRLMQPWAGTVRFSKREAVEWLEQNPATYDVIVDDLSIGHSGDVVKPEASWRVLPDRMRERLRPGGLAISNLLRPEKGSWESGLRRVSGKEPAAFVIEFDEYENRILVAGDFIVSARKCSRQLRATLAALGSRQAQKVRVRAFP